MAEKVHAYSFLSPLWNQSQKILIPVVFGTYVYSCIIIHIYIYIYIYERRSFGVYLTLCLVCLFDYFNYFNYFVAPRLEIIKIIKIFKKIV